MTFVSHKKNYILKCQQAVLLTSLSDNVLCLQTPAGSPIYVIISCVQIRKFPLVVRNYNIRATVMSSNSSV